MQDSGNLAKYENECGNAWLRIFLQWTAKGGILGKKQSEPVAYYGFGKLNWGTL